MENFLSSEFFHTDSCSPLNSVLPEHSTGPGTGNGGVIIPNPELYGAGRTPDLLWLLLFTISDMLYSELKEK